MDIGIAKESEQLEKQSCSYSRLCPRLTNAGHTVYLEREQAKYRVSLTRIIWPAEQKSYIPREEVFLRSK
jgi:hypothetical protein